MTVKAYSYLRPCYIYIIHLSIIYTMKIKQKEKHENFIQKCKGGINSYQAVQTKGIISS